MALMVTMCIHGTNVCIYSLFRLLSPDLARIQLALEPNKQLPSSVIDFAQADIN